MIQIHKQKLRIGLHLLVSALVFFGAISYTEAATMSLSPSTGVYASGSTFTVKVLVNSQGEAINAAEGTLKFNPSELTVVSAGRAGSIFNLWVTEPTFSNSAGTVTFSGGLPSGYTGSAGNIMTVTFRTKGSGAAKINITGGSVLANDGKGTNVLTSMGGGTYTMQAATATPEPEEVIVEYVAPANTPGAPNVSSPTHGDPKKWHTATEAVLNWDIPSGVTSVRTSLDNRSTAIPTKVYDTPIRTLTLSDLDEGVSYFHIQFKNADGWGKVSHYRLAVDSEKPTEIVIAPAEGTDTNNPEQQLKVDVKDSASEVLRFKVQVDNGEPFEFIKENASSTVALTGLTPGYHTVIIEAFDEAGNSIIGNYSFNIESFEKPVFIEIPTEISEQVIPVIKGKTRSNSTVEITLTKIGSEPRTYEVTSDGEGIFTFIPEGRFSNGVYEITARSKDQYGAQSDLSDPVRIAVQQPGLIRIGSFLVSALAVIIPLILMTGLAIAASWYVVMYLRRFRKKIRVESIEALDILHKEFNSLQNELTAQQIKLQDSRKTKKLTGAEQDMLTAFSKALNTSQKNVEKEIKDVTSLTNKSE